MDLNDWSDASLAKLTEAGLRVYGTIPQYHRVVGWLNVLTVQHIGQLDEVGHLALPLPTILNAAPCDSFVNGDDAETAMLPSIHDLAPGADLFFGIAGSASEITSINATGNTALGQHQNQWANIERGWQDFSSSAIFREHLQWSESRGNSPNNFDRYFYQRLGEGSHSNLPASTSMQDEVDSHFPDNGLAWLESTGVALLEQRAPLPI